MHIEAIGTAGGVDGTRELGRCQECLRPELDPETRDHSDPGLVIVVLRAAKYELRVCRACLAGLVPFSALSTADVTELLTPPDGAGAFVCSCGQPVAIASRFKTTTNDGEVATVIDGAGVRVLEYEARHPYPECAAFTGADTVEAYAAAIGARRIPAPPARKRRSSR